MKNTSLSSKSSKGELRLYANFWVSTVFPSIFCRHHKQLVNIFFNYVNNIIEKDCFIKMLSRIVDRDHLDMLISIACQDSNVTEVNENGYSVCDAAEVNGTPTKDVISSFLLDNEYKPSKKKSALYQHPISSDKSKELEQKVLIRDSNCSTATKKLKCLDPKMEEPNKIDRISKKALPAGLNDETKACTNYRKRGRPRGDAQSRYRLRAPPNLWTEEESKRLIVLAGQYGLKSWRQVAKIMNQEFGSNKKAGQCSQHYHRVAAPQINHSHWSQTEDMKLRELALEHSFKWYKVANFMPGRTDTMCRRRYFTLFDEHHYSSSSNL